MRRINLRVPESMIKAGEDARKALGRALSSKGLRSGHLQPTKSGKAFTTASEEERPIYPHLREMWKKPVENLPVAKDIPRLARRVEIVENTDKSCLFKGEPYDGPDTSANQASAEVLVEMITALATRLEPDRVDEIKTELLKIASKVEETSEMADVTETMLSILGPDSPTTRALKTIHQDIVGFCTVELKHHLTSKYPTKDVRTPDGWRIIIHFSEERIQVTHIRREQSVDFGSDQSNHWEFQWELQMFFAPLMKDMHAAQVRVTDLLLSETMDKDLEDELRKTIVGDILVL